MLRHLRAVIYSFKNETQMLNASKGYFAFLQAVLWCFLNSVANTNPNLHIKDLCQKSYFFHVIGFLLILTFMHLILAELLQIGFEQGFFKKC